MILAPHEIFESTTFMNALATAQPIVRKKRKLPKAEMPIFTNVLANVSVLSLNLPV